MAYASQSLPSSLYRPRKLPRVLRRQLPVVWIVATLVCVGLLAVAVTWRNLTYEKLSLDVGRQQIAIQQLNKELVQLSGQVETEASYTKVSRWMRDRHGWWTRTNHVGTIVIPEAELTPAAREDARLLGAPEHE
ncbi:MAG TPA: hypothetical protein VGL38_04040 [bacterium]|jgi:hypothetical protein